jgi:transposase
MMSSSAQVTIEPGLRETPAAPKRRRYSIAEKRRMVEESFQPGASVARVARAHGVNANQVFGWRRLYQRGRLGGNTRAAQAVELLPVTVSDTPAAPVPTPAATPPSLSPGTIQLQLPRGRLRIEGAVDAECLRVVLDCLLA